MNTLTTKTSGDFFFLRGVSHEYVNNSVYPEPATIRSSRVHGTHSFLIPYTNQSYADNDNRYHIIYITVFIGKPMLSKSWGGEERCRRWCYGLGRDKIPIHFLGTEYCKFKFKKVQVQRETNV